MQSILAAALGFLAYTFLAVVGPGLAVLRLLRLPLDPALVLPVGMAVSAGAYWTSLVAGPAWLFPVVIVVLDLTLLRPGPWRRAPGPSLRGAIAPFVAIVAVLALTQYRWNRLDGEGAFLLDPLVAYDTAFHVGLVRELTIGYPPQVPGLSGFPLGYHLGVDLVRAAALRWAGVDPYHAISRFDVTLGALALLLAVRAAAHALGGGPRAVALAGWTLLFTDFSFLFAANPQAHWWTDLLRGNLLLSLALANPVVPGLALTLGCLVALSRADGEDGRRWEILAAGLGLAVPFFKVFLGAHLLLGLGGAALATRRVGRIALLALPLAAATAALVLGQGGRTVAVGFAPLDLVRITRESLGLAPLGAGALVPWAILWLAASLGLRMAGVPEAVGAFARGATPAALATIALCGWPLGLVFRVSAPEVLEGQKTVNDAAYLVEQAGPVLWIFAALALDRLAGTGRRARLALALAALVALPATVQFAVKKAMTAPDPLPAPMVRAMRALAEVSDPGDVVLQRPGARYPPAPVILVGRRVPYERFTPWLTQFAPAEALQERHRAVFQFFRTTDVKEAETIARELRARFACLYLADRFRFDHGGLFEAVHEEPDARCYRLRWAGSVGEHDVRMQHGTRGQLAAALEPARDGEGQ
jgi:hypothetical protein